MNWDRDSWTPEASHSSNNGTLVEAFRFSNIRHTWGESPNPGPYSGNLFFKKKWSAET